MKKLIITMMAIAFSLSAYSETDTIFVLDFVPDRHPDEFTTVTTPIVVWCINDYVFVRTATIAGETMTQMNHLVDGETRPMTCPRYIEGKWDETRMRNK